jgi:hypothetical protein
LCAEAHRRQVVRCGQDFHHGMAASEALVTAGDERR